MTRGSAKLAIAALMMLGTAALVVLPAQGMTLAQATQREPDDDEARAIRELDRAQRRAEERAREEARRQDEAPVESDEELREREEERREARERAAERAEEAETDAEGIREGARESRDQGQALGHATRPEDAGSRGIGSEVSREMLETRDERKEIMEDYKASGEKQAGKKPWHKDYDPEAALPGKSDPGGGRDDDEDRAEAAGKADKRNRDEEIGGKGRSGKDTGGRDNKGKGGKGKG